MREREREREKEREKERITVCIAVKKLLLRLVLFFERDLLLFLMRIREILFSIQAPGMKGVGGATREGGVVKWRSRV